MAAELIMRREGQALKPRDAHSMELLMAISTNDDVMAKITVPRNLKQHQLLWVMMNKIADNHPTYRSGADVLREIKMRLGMLKPYIIVDHKTGNAKTVYEIESMSFASMDQVRFRKFFNDAKDVIAERILPGISDDVLFAELLEMM